MKVIFKYNKDLGLIKAGTEVEMFESTAKGLSSHGEIIKTLNQKGEFIDVVKEDVDTTDNNDDNNGSDDDDDNVDTTDNNDD